MAYDIEENIIREALAEWKTITGAAGSLGISYNAFARLAKKYGCFQPNQGGRGCKKVSRATFTKDDLEKVFRGEKLLASYKLKLRLFQFNLKEKACEICGLKEWQGVEIPLELHHKNGNRLDNSFENLQIVCPNCHALTEHYRGANTISHKEKAKVVKKITPTAEKPVRKPREKKVTVEAEPRFCEVCNKQLSSPKQKRFCCRECYNKWQMKDIPSEEELREAMKTHKSMLALGKAFDVSDNAVRKWLEKYNIKIK